MFFFSQVIPDEDIYHFAHESIVKRSINPSVEHHRSLAQENRVANNHRSQGLLTVFCILISGFLIRHVIDLGGMVPAAESKTESQKKRSES